jgi:hypothetical protein
MEKIKLFEDFKHKEIHDFFNDGINPTMYWAYRKSCEAENDILDFNDVIWEHDIQPIVDTCNKVGITEFTISSNFTGLLKTIYELDKRGFKTVGVTEVRANYMDFYKQDKAIVPAVHIRKVLEKEE